MSETNDSVEPMEVEEVVLDKPSRSTNLRATGVMASYGVGKFQAEFFTGAFGALVFYFYETQLGLRIGLVTLGLVLYSLWNAINDPIIGFLTERPTPLSYPSVKETR
ncbi:MAG: MFS transporter [Candidatus Heimdallarchaeota archaeon]